MSRQYTKVNEHAEEIYKKRATGKNHWEIDLELGLSKKQSNVFMKRQRMKERKLVCGYIPRPKGRPWKDSGTEEIRKDN